MKNTLHGLALGAGLLGIVPAALASSHREAPAISKDPAADNTDTYAWVTKTTHDKLNIVVGYNPMEEPAGGPNFNEFSDDVLYEINITRGANQITPTFTYQFQFTTVPYSPRSSTQDIQSGAPGGGKEFFVQLTGRKQTLTVTKIVNGNPTVIARNVPVAPPNIGPFSYTNFQKGQAASTTYDDAFAATFIGATSEGGRVWAGPRDDGFYVDLGGVFDAAQLRAKGMAQDGVAGYNVHAIALEIPTKNLTANGQNPPNTASNENLLGIWAAASRRQINIRLRNGVSYSYGPWVQVSRLGLPLINEAVIGIQDKDYWNAVTPASESYFFPYFLNPVVVRDAEAVGIYKALAVDPTPFKTNRLDIVDLINLKNIPAAGAHNVPLTATGDVLRVDIGVDSQFPNGRSIPGGPTTRQEQVDVTDALLSVLLSKGAVSVKDNVDYNDKVFLTDMPWLPLPWRGYDQGHGKATP